MKTLSSILSGLLLLTACPLPAAEPLRVGLIGLDTSHVIAFTSILHDATHKNHVPGARVVAGFKGGSPDIESSWSRVDQYTQQLQDQHGVKIYDTIEEMCRHVDAVMLESVDGRPHLEQARPVIAAGKPLYIDKPMAGSLRDVLEIFRLAREAGVPVFSSSSLRYGRTTQEVRGGSLGKVTHAETWSPAHVEKTHPDLFWYGVHGVESLFTVMGTGCQTVTRGKTDDGRIEVIGQWEGGRTGIFREAKSGYGGLAKGEKGESPVGAYDGYHPLVAEIVTFFQTKKPPVAAEETIELFAFMEAADESKRRGGEAVSIKEVLQKAGWQK